MRIPEFRKLIYKEEELVEFLIGKNILQIPICNKCEKPMTRTKGSIYKYRCYLRREKKKCSNDSSLLKDSVFKFAKMSVESLLILLCEWVKGSNINSASMELDVNPSTISKWYMKFDNRVYNFFYRNICQESIGGHNCIVEIDETVLVKNKYHNGRLLAYQVWAVGGVVRGNPQTFFFEIVENRNRNTLIELIRRKIAPGTTIITDCWRGYLNIRDICQDMGYNHETINHSENFVDPDTGAHTQTIEGMWSVIKRQMRKDGTNHGTLLNLVKKVYIRRFKLLFRENLLDIMLNFFSINEASDLMNYEPSELNIESFDVNDVN